MHQPKQPDGPSRLLHRTRKVGGNKPKLEGLDDGELQADGREGTSGPTEEIRLHVKTSREGRRVEKGREMASRGSSGRDIWRESEVTNLK
jgi:hypothetical protein